MSLSVCACVDPNCVRVRLWSRGFIMCIIEIIYASYDENKREVNELLTNAEPAFGGVVGGPIVL